MVHLALSKSQKALLAVFSGVASDMFGLTLVIPVMAAYAIYLGSTAKDIGIMFSVFTAGSSVASMIVGYLADKYGKRFVLLYASFGAAVCFLLGSMCVDYTQFIISRGLAGLFSGTISTSYAYVTEVVKPKDIPKYMSYISATMSSCFVIGPLIGGGLAMFGIRVPFYCAAAFGFIALFNAYFFIIEPSELKRLEAKKNDDYDGGSMMNDGMNNVE